MTSLDAVNEAYVVDCNYAYAFYKYFNLFTSSKMIFWNAGQMFIIFYINKVTCTAS